MQTTIDGLLNQRVKLEQPAKGFRVAVDTVLLAAAVPAKAGQGVLDMGCGVGGAMLCLAVRVPGLHITGIEIQPELVEICRRNILRNEFAAGMEVVEGDVVSSNLNGYHHIMMNPPYHDEARHDVSADAIKRTANTEKEGDLALWIDAATKALAPDGILTLIHRADRLEEIVALLAAFGRVDILPIIPRAGGRAKRVLVRADLRGEVRTSDGGGRTCIQFQHEPFLLCEPRDLGNEIVREVYTADADDILRHAKSLYFGAK